MRPSRLPARRDAGGRLVLTEYRVGGLYVLEAPHTKDHLNRELRELDERLFAERQVTIGGEVVWCVCLFPYRLATGEDVVVTVHEHRDGNGVPIGYPTTRMVDEVKRMMQRGPLDMKEIDRRNHELRERRRTDAYYELGEMARDRHRSANPLRAELLPRSRSLQMSRDKARSRGVKI